VGKRSGFEENPVAEFSGKNVHSLPGRLWIRLADLGSLGEIGRGLAAILLGRDYQLPQPRESVPVDPKTLKDYVGTYRIDGRNVRRVVLQGGALAIEREGGRRYPIVPYAKDRFFFVHDRGASLCFVRDEEGVVSAHIIHQLGVDETARKLTGLPDCKE
jgi:hypothetical protein